MVLPKPGLDAEAMGGGYQREKGGRRKDSLLLEALVAAAHTNVVLELSLLLIRAADLVKEEIVSTLERIKERKATHLASRALDKPSVPRLAERVLRLEVRHAHRPARRAPDGRRRLGEKRGAERLRGVGKGEDVGGAEPAADLQREGSAQLKHGTVGMRTRWSTSKGTAVKKSSSTGSSFFFLLVLRFFFGLSVSRGHQKTDCT